MKRYIKKRHASRTSRKTVASSNSHSWYACLVSRAVEAEYFKMLGPMSTCNPQVNYAIQSQSTLLWTSFFSLCTRYKDGVLDNLVRMTRYY
jgi:hypothetical protein